jgi:ubiquinone/menaquinone biosynthesis C-methylase UbiE
LIVNRSPQSRLEWCVARVGAGPDDRILEIGCGHGVAASLVCAGLTTGRLTAVDRSAKMIDMARRRNAGFVAAGRAAFHVAAFVPGAPGLDDGPFDRVFAIHVPVFLRGDPRRELALVRDLLASGGRFCVPFQQLEPQEVPAAIAKISADVAAAGLTVVDTVEERIASGPVGCVTATL